MHDWRAERERFLRDPDAFWAEAAKQFVLDQALGQSLRVGRHSSQVVRRRDAPTSPSTRSTATPNRRRATAPPLSGWAKTAPSASSPIGQLYRDVCRFANGLKSLGVKKGDRVVIYMPLTIEGASRCWPARASAPSTPWSMPDWATPRCATASKTRRRKSSLPAMPASAAASRVR